MTRPLAADDKNETSRVKKGIRGFILLLAVFVALMWFRGQTVKVILRNDRCCAINFHPFGLGTCTIYYYENGACIGETRLHSDFFDTPFALFPSKDGDSVICFSFLDTTYATFAIDVTRRNTAASLAHLRLQVPAEPVVDSSDFAVRACTQEEIDYLKNYIQSADPALIAKQVAGRGSSKMRENLLTHLAWSSHFPDMSDPVLKFANPQVLPVGSSEYPVRLSE